MLLLTSLSILFKHLTYLTHCFIIDTNVLCSVVDITVPLRIIPSELTTFYSDSSVTGSGG